MTPEEKEKRSITITIATDSGKVTLSLEDAKHVYEELKRLFNE